jgi:hypothetical protein
MLRENRDQEGQDKLDKALEPSKHAPNYETAKLRILAAGGEVG